MNIAIIGSRTFNDYDMLVKEVTKILHVESKCEEDFTYVTIVSGGATGADALGKKYAKEFKCKYVEFNADWKDLSHPDARIKTNAYGKYDANAGHRRNTLIIDKADIVIAFHNDSPGTANSLKKARDKGKKIYEFKF